MDTDKNYDQSNFSSFDQNKKQKYWIGGFAALAFVFLAIHFLLELIIFSVWDEYLPLVKKLSLSIFFIFIVLLIGKFIEKLIATRSSSRGTVTT